MALIRILESDDWFVDYDRDRGMYRVSYFQDNHFLDECWFDAYEEEKKWHLLKDKSPQLNKLVSVKIIVNGEERVYLDYLVYIDNEVYQWAYNNYGNAEITWAYKQ